MTQEEPRPVESSWTTSVGAPPVAVRIAAYVHRVVLAISALVAVTMLIASVWFVLTLGPGARIRLADGVSFQVPPHRIALSFGKPDPKDLIVRGYGMSDLRDEYGGMLGVDLLNPRLPSRYLDPARMAVHARERGLEVRGPVHFHRSGLEVTATVEPTLGRSRHEGAYSVKALVGIRGRHVFIQADNNTIGVSESADPRTMAEAAIDMLRLTAE